MSSIKNVAIIGASGSLGSKVLEALQKSGLFNIKALKRESSTATFPEGIQVADVDLTSVESLTAALQGQDALVSTLGNAQIGDQKLLVDASVAAGVKRFIPSEYGCDMENLKARALPVYRPKVQIQDYIIEKSKATDLTYTFVYNCAFLDWGLQKGPLLKVAEYKPTIFDGGDLPFSVSALSGVGDAVVGVLKSPEETKNRSVRIEEIKITQNKLLKIAKELAPEKPWAPIPVNVDDLIAKANERLSQGLFDPHTFLPFLLRAVVTPGYGGNFETNDNELLGIKTKTEADIAEILKPLLK